VKIKVGVWFRLDAVEISKGTLTREGRAGRVKFEDWGRQGGGDREGTSSAGERSRGEG
jgi:hypothetical protein